MATGRSTCADCASNGGDPLAMRELHFGAATHIDFHRTSGPPLTMSQSNSPLESMVAKAESLYTLPAVAMEVIRLTDSDRVDTRALKECIERDPALAAKLLKVVNSSLFGLVGKVENLTQAIALLGIKPLKLLVLGFSLPSELLTDLDAEQLARYWRGALTRAVVARQLAEAKWQIPGDDAFLVALLQDVGMLVLLQQLATPYARFLAQVRNERGRLVELEQTSLGFDHRELTAALLSRWHLPEMYTKAILDTPSSEDTSQSRDPRAIVQVLSLANLFVELVGEHRLQVLPELLELGAQYCDLTKDDVSKLVSETEPRVDQLAGVLQVELGGAINYTQVLTAAHQQLSEVAADAAGMLMLTEQELYDNVLTESRDLQQAVREFPQYRTAEPANNLGERTDGPAATPRPRTMAATSSVAHANALQRLTAGVTAAATACRARREPLSLLTCETTVEDQSLGIDCRSALEAGLQQLASEIDLPSEHIFRLASSTIALVLPNTERRDAVEIARTLAEHCGDAAQLAAVQLKAGAAQVAAIPKGFDSQCLIDAADGCLEAARASGGTSTKSIEVY